MIGTHSEMRPGTWRVPECPVLIEYSPALLDEIRLAVVDAFFSLPRGGAEIGGVLFGQHDEASVRIEAFRPMVCEHAMGPTFVLSERDKTKLKVQLEESANDPLLHGLEIVGWYHSHTRSEIFLSDLDLEIYNQYFPSSWHVALVLRPAGMKPTRAGFFFRDREGVVRTTASYHEFILGPVMDAQASGNGHTEPAVAPVRRAPEPAPKPAPEPVREAKEPAAEQNGATPPLPAAAALLSRLDAPPEPPLEAGSEVEKQPAEFVPPAFMIPPEQQKSRTRLWLALGLLAAACAAGYFSAGFWVRVFTAKPVYLHLQALDHNGQLSIQWDRAAIAAAGAKSGTLEIVDGPSSTTLPLDAGKLRAGNFQYARRNEIVEVHLTVKGARGAPLEEFTSFYGRQQPAAASTPNTEPEKPKAELAAEAERARGDLKKQELRALEAERALEQMRQMMRRDEERKRVENQMPAAGAAQPSESRPPVRTPTPPTQTANNVNPPPRGNPPVSSLPAAAPATPNATPQEKPQGVVQGLVPQASKPLAPPPDKQPTATERPPTLHAAPPIQPPARTPAPTPQPVNRPAAAPPTAPPTPAPTTPAQPALSGRWVYSPASKSGSAYPPESVTLMLVQADNQINGTFSGRYKVPKNNKLNPKVNFSFEGPLHPNSSKFNFTAADGMRGQIELIRLPGKQNAIEVVWYSERDKLTFDDLFFRVP